MPTAALCPLGEKATAVGDEETARDRLELEKEQEEREEVRNAGKETGIHFCISVPGFLSPAVTLADLASAVQFQKGCRLLFGGRIWD